MTNVGELWRNIACAGVTCAGLLWFAGDGSFLSFFVGLAYAWFFEYFYHRSIGHTNLFPLAAEKHRDHHRHWRGPLVTSRDRTRGELNESWYFFPAALLAHFWLPWLSGYVLPWTVLVAFTLFYVQFEVFHWATHIDDNIIDKLLIPIPLIGTLRMNHIYWHIQHHVLPAHNYNFTPPYPGDYVFRTEKTEKRYE